MHEPQQRSYLRKRARSASSVVGAWDNWAKAGRIVAKVVTCWAGLDRSRNARPSRVKLIPDRAPVTGLKKE